MASKIGYVAAEFPGQTHTWMWREIGHLREWGVQIQIFATRKPLSRDSARHDFAALAAAEAIYLWPIPMYQALIAVLWAAGRPLKLMRCIKLGFTLPVERPAWRTVLPLVLPACLLARESHRLGVSRLHSHSCSNCAVLCMMAKRLLGIPFSMTLNANIEIWGGAMAAKFEDADFTIAITRRLLEQVRRDFPSLAPQQALLGRIGVDTRKWVRADRPRDHRGPTRLLSVARLAFGKGHDVLLRAVKLLVEGGADVTLDVVGDGPLRPNLEAQAVADGLTERVNFHGSLGESQIIDKMHDADIFVLASLSEPLGVAYMEAMAMEVATIGTAAGGVGEIITHDENGVLVPPNDPEAIASAIRALIGDSARRERLARAGRRSIVEQFDSRLGARTLYERLFGHPPAEAKFP